MKLTSNPDGCQTFVCQCKPQEECEPIPTLSDEELASGMERIIDKSGCCPVAELLCKPDKCPEAQTCQKYYQLKKSKSPGDCCHSYKCEPPKDKCLYEMKYVSAASGGERPRTKLERELLAKQVNSRAAV